MIKKVFKQMLLAQILSAMAITLCMIIDSIMIGRFLGVEAMAAYGFANPILLVFTAMGQLISSGLQVVCANFMGKGDTKSLNTAYSTSVIFSMILAFVSMGAVLIFADGIAVMLGAPEGSQVAVYTADYLRGFVLSSPFLIGAQVMIPFLQMAGKRNLLVVAVVGMTIGDIVLDYLNVASWGLGTYGMGIASTLSYVIAFVIGIVYFLSPKCVFKFKFNLAKLSALKDIFKSGIPAFINSFALVMLVFVLNKLLVNQAEGTLGVAAYSCIQSVSNICYAVSSGVGSIAIILSGMLYGEEDRSGMYDVIKAAFFYSILLNVIVTALMLIFAPFIIRLFLDDQATIDIAATGLRLFSLSLIFSALNTAVKEYYHGMNRIVESSAICFLQNFAMAAISGLILSGIMGTNGVFLAYLGGELLTFIAITAYVSIRNHKFSVKPESYALLPDDFGAEGDNIFEYVIKNAQQVIEASQGAGDYCKAHGRDKKTSFFVALCIEEMCNNYVQYGFTGKKDDAIEIRLVNKGGRWILRIRNNSESFDPVEYMKLHQDEDKTSHMGIRLVCGTSEDAVYVNSLGLNNLMVTF